jgi:hypothetical protein
VVWDNFKIESPIYYYAILLRGWKIIRLNHQSGSDSTNSTQSSLVSSYQIVDSFHFNALERLRLLLGDEVERIDCTMDVIMTHILEIMNLMS